MSPLLYVHCDNPSPANGWDVGLWTDRNGTAEKWSTGILARGSSVGFQPANGQFKNDHRRMDIHRGVEKVGAIHESPKIA